jgi:PAS domain S-box-containing protein
MTHAQNPSEPGESADASASITRSLTILNTTESFPSSEHTSWLYQMLMSMGDALIATDAEGKVLFLNPLAERLTGWTLEEARGQEVAAVYQAIDEASGEAVQRLLVEIARGGEVMAVKVDMELIARDGSRLSIQDSAEPIKNAVGETTGVVVVFRDSSEQRENRRKIEAFNARLQQAMAETNHRIKNNLQVVAALVDLQAEEAGSLPADAVQKLSIHIKTLAHLHDFLTQEATRGEELTYISAQETLAKLVPLIQATVSGRLVSFTSDAVRLPTKQSSSLALIVNELISNALKHGKGKIDIMSAFQP